MLINRKWILSRTFIVLLLLSTPLIEGFFIQGEDRYYVHQEKLLKLNYIGKTIYQPGPPIDFLFLGPSSMWASVNAKIIQEELRQRNHNENIIVENFGHNHIGTDLDFIILKDLIKNRGVKTLFLGMPPIRQKEIHRSMRYIWNPLTDSDLPFKTYAALYSEKLLDSIPNMVRYFLMPTSNVPQIISYMRQRNGSLIFNRDYIEGKERVPYQQLSPTPLNLSLKDVLMPSSDKSVEAIMDFLPHQEHFFKAIIKLTAEHKINFFVLFPPTALTDKGKKKFRLLTFQGNIRPPVNYIGIHINRMFPEQDIQEVKKFYFDPAHTNGNGSEYFTRSLLQPLQEIYETTNH